jgi:pentapeptide MXKDX repeat protein
LENKKKNNYESLKNTLINRLSNTEYGGMLQLLGYNNKNTGKTNDDMGNIMNLFGDMGELKKLFNDSESTSKSSNKNNDCKKNDQNNKISDPKWLAGHITSTEDLDKYLLSEIASNKDLKKIANLNNNKIIELNTDNVQKDNLQKDNLQKDNVKKDNLQKDNVKKDNVKKDNVKKDSKKDKNEKNSEELVNLFKKMNDVFSTMSIKNNKEINENSG